MPQRSATRQAPSKHQPAAESAASCTAPNTPEKLWLEPLTVAAHRQVAVTVGPLRLTLGYSPGEWWVAWRHCGTLELDAEDRIGQPEPLDEEHLDHEVRRFLSRRLDGRLALHRALADRPVVARPERCLMIPAGDEVTIFVSTPVWVRCELPDPPRRLLEIPVTRPSDTWFGPDTRRGTVAYASQTAARLNLDNLPAITHRAITPVTVRNEADSVLPLDRLCVPAPNLGLYRDVGGGLWTSPLVAIRDSASGPAKVEARSEVPAQAPGATRIAEPREPIQRSVLSRALHVLGSSSP